MAAAAGGQPAAVPADGVRAGRRSPGGLRHGGSDRRVGRRRGVGRTVFRIVLSHTRKAYSEVVYRQTTEDFMRCLENAFWHFGGVPRTLVIDNLKAAVTQADWFDPELNPKVQSFCEHYGTVILPTRPLHAPAQGQGRTRRGVRAGQRPEGPDLRQPGRAEPAPAGLGDARRRHADPRHDPAAGGQGASRRWSGRPCCRCRRSGSRSSRKARRKVHRDGHVEVAKAYYSVPPEYLGREVWVRWDGRLVRIFNQPVRADRRARPARAGPVQHAGPAHRRTEDRGVERGTRLAAGQGQPDRAAGRPVGRADAAPARHRGRAGAEGPAEPGEAASGESIEQACETASTHGAYRLRTIRELLKRQGDRQEQFAFLAEHPIIRPLSDYGDLVHTAFQKEEKP